MKDKRGTVPVIPPPTEVSPSMIARCRTSVDSPLKFHARRILNIFTRVANRGTSIGEGFQLGSGVKLPLGSRIGRYCYIGKGFSSPSPLSIGDLCMISTDVKVVGADHGIRNPNLPSRLCFQWSHSVTILGADVWIGHGSIILSGIRIGSGSVIATGSVVTKDVPPNVIVGGNPARIIRERFGAEDWRRYLGTLGCKVDRRDCQNDSNLSPLC